MPNARTSTKEFLESVSDFISRQRGGLHSQHVQGHHNDKPNKACELCQPKRNEILKEPFVSGD